MAIIILNNGNGLSSVLKTPLIRFHKCMCMYIHQIWKKKSDSCDMLEISGVQHAME